ncbi:MAG: ABC transporter substrate-binding protein [Patulibacter sp.]
MSQPVTLTDLDVPPVSFPSPRTSDDPSDRPRRSVRRGRGVAALLAVVAGVTLAGGVAAPQADARTYNRVVTLTPFQSNVVARLGVRPVAVGSDVGNGLRLHPGLNRVPRLALSHPDGPNLEQLLRLRPNLLLSSPNWRVGNAKLRRRGLAVSDAWEPTRVQNVSPGVRRIAKLVGRSSRANAITRQIDAGIRSARAGIRSNPKVLLVLGVGRSTIAFLPNSWGGDMIRYAGGRLVTSGLKPSYNAGVPGSFAPLSDERVLTMNPDVIIVVPHGRKASLPNTVAFFRKKPGWKATKAARNNRIHIADADSLLQASDNPGAVISHVRRNFLRN